MESGCHERSQVGTAAQDRQRQAETGHRKEADMFLSELTQIFDCALQSVHNMLKKLGITRKKRCTYREASAESRAQFDARVKMVPRGASGSPRTR